MSPARPTVMDDPSTGEVRLLDAADECRAAQAALRADLGEIKVAMGRLEVHAATIAAAASTASKIGDWLSGWTWRGGLVLILLLASPWLLALGSLLLLAGRAGDVAALISAS